MHERFEAHFPIFAAYLGSGEGGPVEYVLPPMSPTEVRVLETDIGVPLPRSYVAFLQTTRGLILGDGLQMDRIHPFFHEFKPWEQLTPRQQATALLKGSPWPPPSQGMLCFADFKIMGDGDQVLFDVRGSLVDGEYPVYYYDHERPAVHRIAESFGEWLEQIVTGRKEVRID